jgi:hemerythrin-like domain-containing protein
MRLLTLILGLLIFSPAMASAAAESPQITPNEDLMREHGILDRLLLIYQEIARRIDNHESFPHQALANAARIVRDFVEDYHERLEEDYVFPRFQGSQLAGLVETLREQHNVGRQLTDYIMAHSSDAILSDEIQRMTLADHLRLYVRMFRPHEAREDTVLYPAFRKLLSNEEYMKLGETFEEREEQLFGQDGFEKIVAEVEKTEKQLGIYNLSEFTPNIKKES